MNIPQQTTFNLNQHTLEIQHMMIWFQTQFGWWVNSNWIIYKIKCIFNVMPGWGAVFSVTVALLFFLRVFEGFQEVSGVKISVGPERHKTMYDHFSE